MKKILCIVLCGLVALAATACGEEKPAPTEATEPTAPAAVTEPVATSDESDAGSELRSFISRFDDTPTVGDQPVYEDKNIKVTAHGINYAPIAGPEIHLTVENHYDKDITVQAPYAVVNDYMISPELKIDVPAGKTVSGNLRLPYFSLAIADITQIRVIEFSLSVEDSRSYKKLLTTDVCALSTSAASSTPDEAVSDPASQPIYDKGGIKLELRGVNTARPYSDGPELTVYMENNTGRTVKILTEDVIVNGCEMTSVMNRGLLPGKRAVDIVPFYRMDLDEYDIKTIDGVQVSFTIRDAESWEEIASTNLIKVTLDNKKQNEK